MVQYTGYTGLVPGLNFRQLYSEPKVDFNQPDIIDSYKKAKDDEINRQSKQYLNASNKSRLDSEVQEGGVRTLSLIAIQIKPYLQGYDQNTSGPMPEDKKAAVRNILTSSKAKIQDQNLLVEIDHALDLLENNKIKELSAAISELEGLAQQYKRNNSSSIYAPQGGELSGVPNIGDEKADGTRITEADRKLGNWKGRAIYDPNTDKPKTIWFAYVGKAEEAAAVEGAKNPALRARKQGESDIDYSNRLRILDAEEEAEWKKLQEGGSKAEGAALEVKTGNQKGASEGIIADVNIKVTLKEKLESAKADLTRALDLTRAYNNVGGVISKASAFVQNIVGWKPSEGEIAPARFHAEINKLVVAQAKLLGSNPTDNDARTIASTLPNTENDSEVNIQILQDSIDAINDKLAKIGNPEQDRINTARTGSLTTPARAPSAVSSGTVTPATKSKINW
jgi:hypothetical protein